MEEKQMKEKIHSFFIDRKLPSLNEYTKLNRTNYRAGNRMKADCQSYIRGCIYYHLKKLQIENPVIVHVTWVEDNKRRDLDNIRFAIKFILDALVEVGTLKDDSQKYVKGFTDKFEYKKHAGVNVELEEIEE
jgi:Holliday junction resolvase RusA-like endonuclease